MVISSRGFRSLRCDPDLDEAGVVGKQPFQAAAGLGPDEAGLDGAVRDCRALIVDYPGAANVLEERPDVVGEDAFLTKLKRVYRGVVPVPAAAPRTEQPRDRGTGRVQVVRDLERHQSLSVALSDLKSL